MSNPPTKRAKTTKMKDYIPEEIILQILHKLPIKSILRFTCLSKTWLSQIKNPTFISTHLKLTISSSNKNPLLFIRYCSDTPPSARYSLRFDDEWFNHYMHFRFPFKPLYSYYDTPCFRLAGTINGLICFAHAYTITIWNPLIRKSVSLPEPTIACRSRVPLGFGFDSRSNDYKVLRLVDIRRYVDGYDLQAEVYSLNTNSWKRIDGVPRYKIRRPERHVFVNGVLHFLASRRVNNDKKNLILGFHVGDEVFKEIMLPESLVNESPQSLNVFVCGDETIAVLEQPQRSILRGERRVWVMEEYGMVQSWSRIFSFNGLGEVLGFKKNRELFLEMYTHEMEMVSFKPENHDIRQFGVSGDRGLGFIDYFVESLVLLDNANAVADGNVENDAIEDFE